MRSVVKVILLVHRHSDQENDKFGLSYQQYVCVSVQQHYEQGHASRVRVVHNDPSYLSSDTNHCVYHPPTISCRAVADACCNLRV